MASSIALTIGRRHALIVDWPHVSTPSIGVGHATDPISAATRTTAVPTVPYTPVRALSAAPTDVACSQRPTSLLSRAQTADARRVWIFMASVGRAREWITGATISTVGVIALMRSVERQDLHVLP